MKMSFKEAVIALAAGTLGLVSSNVLATDINLLDPLKPTMATYAKETLTSAAVQKGSDNKTYYLVTAPNAPAVLDEAGTVTTQDAPVPNWMVSGKVGIGAPEGEMLVVRYDFENMVLVTPLADESLVLDGTTPALLLGGGIGENFVAFSVPINSPLDAGTAEALTLSLGDTEIAVSPTAPVNVSVSVSLRGFSDVVPPYTASYPSAVTVANALSVSSTAMSPTASVEHAFKQFTGGTPMMGNLGSVTLEAKDYRMAMDINLDPLDDQDTNAGEPLSSLGQILMPGKFAGSGDPASGTLYSVDGDFSFVKDATFSPTDNGCGTESIVSRDEDTDEILESSFMDRPWPEAALAGRTITKALCVELYSDDKAMVVPTTSPYEITLNLKPVLEDSLISLSDLILTLGNIKRDGTTAHIPYLSTYEGYNHRITLSNRGSRPAAYEFTFRPEIDVMATPGMYAEGVLAGHETKILRAEDVVTLSGGKRTAATVTVVAPRGSIDVSTTLVNKSTGTAVVTWAEKE